MVFEKKIRLKVLQIALEASLKRGLKKLKKEDLCTIDERLAALAPLVPLQLLSTPEEVVSKIFQPFIDAIALLAAITFGIGILGFVIIILDAALSWVTGGSFGRSLAVSKFIRAAETLAIIPISFFIVYVLNSLGIQEISSTAQIMDTLLRRGWSIIIGILTKGG